MIKTGLFFALSTATLFAVTGPGCSDNAIDRAYDCDQICDAYKECVDPNYDDDACGANCREEAADSEAYEDQADECQDCIDDANSCSATVFNCSAECAGIVP